MSDVQLIAAPLDRLPGDFHDIARQVYADDPCWIPEDAAATDAAFSAANPWFESGRAWIAVVPGKARAALFAPDGLMVEGVPAAFFGYYESIGDVVVEQLLMTEVESQARACGARRLLGPVNFGTAGRYRLRTLHDESRSWPRNSVDLPFVDEPHNPVGYGPSLLARGYHSFAEYLTHITELPRERHEQGRATMTDLESAGYRFEALGTTAWLNRANELHPLVNAVFASNPGFQPLPRGMFDRVCGESFIRKYCSRCSVLALAPDGAVAGFFLVLPHYGPLVAQGAGPVRVPVGELDYATHFPALQAIGRVHAIGKTIGVLPAQRQHGLMNAMTAAAFDRGESIYSLWLGALIRADNASRRVGTRTDIGKRWYVLLARELD